MPAPDYRAVPPERIDRGRYAAGVERVADVQAELHQLHSQHWDETERLYLTGDADALRPDYLRAARLQDAGVLVLFTLRAMRGPAPYMLVGNMIFYVQYSLHDSQRLQATEDVLFISRPHRGRVVLPFLDYVEGTLKGFGVHSIAISDKQPCGGPDLSNLLGRRGYAPVARLFRKPL